MTSCSVEAFNAAWSAAGFGFAAGAALAFARMTWAALNNEEWPMVFKNRYGDAEVRGRSEDNRFWVSLVALAVTALALWGASYQGQNAVRYLHASTAGYECQHDGSHRVTIIRGGN